MPKQEIIIIGHGSRNAEAVAEFKQFAAALAIHLDKPVSPCFLELADPEMNVVLHNAAHRIGTGGELLILPMFLGTAFHMKAEISEAVEHIQEDFPDLHVHYSTALGVHRKLVELLKVRVEEALAATPNALFAEETTVLLVGGGSSHMDSNSSVSRTGRMLWELGGYANVEVAYQRVTHPTTAEGLQRAHLLGAKQIVLVPYLLFTGLVWQRTIAAAEAQAAELGILCIYGQYLGPDHPLLLEVAEQRLKEADNGVSDMLRQAEVEGLPLVQGGGDHSHSHHHHH